MMMPTRILIQKTGIPLQRSREERRTRGLAACAAWQGCCLEQPPALLTARCCARPPS